jgi:hypothetical protein
MTVPVCSDRSLRSRLSLGTERFRAATGGSGYFLTSTQERGTDGHADARFNSHRVGKYPIRRAGKCMVPLSVWLSIRMALC